MKYSAVLILFLLISLNVFAQKPKVVKKSPATAKASEIEADTANEKDEFEKASALTDPASRADALEKFVKNFPKSASKIQAQELLSIADAQVGGDKLKNNQMPDAVRYFKLAVQNAPLPVSDKLFSEILLQIPSALFFGGARESGIESAQTLETKTGGSARQTLGLATFYLSIENGDEAVRLANRAAALEPNLPAAYQTLGIAHRLNFEPDEAVNAYAKALELDPNSTVSKRNLAEMNRAAGKSDQAVTLYRELLAKDETDAQAQTGLALALFDAEKQTEAETEMAKVFAQNPNNLTMLVGAAYWYAAHNDGAKAIDLGNHAAAFEPRYVWAHIALARGFLQQKRPLEAERTLLEAKQYGNFPTLTYEIASARLQAGFYREAAETLKDDFTVSDGTVSAKLGGRVEKNAKSFIELLSPERRAGIFEPLAADNPENAERLRNLLALMQNLENQNAVETDVLRAADAFIEGGDPMKVYRQIYVARRLLESKPNSPKTLEIAQTLVGKADAALNAPNSAAAVLAEALYDTRRSAALKNEVVLVPDVPRPTLSAILRGEIEEITGWAYFQQNKTDDAVIHLKRAISVLPGKSSFWRSSMWRLGAALQGAGNDKDALDAYLKSYPADAPSAAKYSVIEYLYKKINGSDDGLEAKIGAKPAELNIESPPTTVTTAVAAAPKIEPTPAPEIAAAPTPETPSPSAAVTETPAAPVPTPEISATPAPTPEAIVQTLPLPAETPVENAAPPTDAPNVPTAEIIKPNVNPVETAVNKEQTAPPTAETDVKPDAPPTAIPTPAPPVIDSQPAGKPSVLIVDNTPVKAAEPSVPSNNTAKPLFEPIIIQVPKTEIIKAPKPTITENPPNQTLKTPSETPVSTENTEKADSQINQPAVSPTDFSRPRVVVTENIGNAPETPRCTLNVSQENVSIINNGGSLSVIVSFENQADAAAIKASSSSPQDVAVEIDADIGTSSGRSLYIIKSISANPGEYKVSFETACGKREINVRVR